MKKIFDFSDQLSDWQTMDALGRESKRETFSPAFEFIEHCLNVLEKDDEYSGDPILYVSLLDQMEIFKSGIYSSHPIVAFEKLVVGKHLHDYRVHCSEARDALEDLIPTKILINPQIDDENVDVAPEINKITMAFTLDLLHDELEKFNTLTKADLEMHEENTELPSVRFKSYPFLIWDNMVTPASTRITKKRSGEEHSLIQCCQSNNRDVDYYGPRDAIDQAKHTVRLSNISSISTSLDTAIVNCDFVSVFNSRLTDYANKLTSIKVDLETMIKIIQDRFGKS